VSSGPKNPIICTLELYDPRTDRGQHSYRPLSPEDRLYRAAAAAYRMQEDLPVEARRALLCGLADAWPRVQGSVGGHSDYRGAVLAAYHRRGWTVEELARAWVGYSTDDIRRLIRRAEERMTQESRSDREPRVDAINGEPPSLEELSRVPCSEKQAQQRREDHKRAAALGEQFRDVLGTLAPLAPALARSEHLEQFRAMPEFDTDQKPKKKKLWWLRRPGDEV